MTQEQVQEQQRPEFPVLSKQRTAEVQGVATEFLAQRFADRLFVVVTQYGKIGSLYLATMAALQQGDNAPSADMVFDASANGDNRASVNVVRLLGASGTSDGVDVNQILATEICGAIHRHASARRPILLGIALRPHPATQPASDTWSDDQVSWQRERLQQIQQHLSQVCVW
ncbi:hypothetical protein RI367_007488 [Sorochytrium milnesiophthora]